MDVIHCQPVMDFFMAVNEINAYILAGGGSRRMGCDKLFLQIDGRSLLERTIAVCEECFERVYLVSGNVDKFVSLNYPVVPDSPRAYGPMAGVIAALEVCKNDYCFVTAADLFDLRTEVIASLVNKYNNQQYLGLFETEGVQPLCGIYHKSALEVFYQFAQNNEFSMKKAVKVLNHDGVVLPHGQWRNINSPEDLKIGGLSG